MRRLGLLCLLLMLPVVAAAAVPSQIYRVAVDAEYAPYEFRDIDGAVKGMLPDMLEAIGRIEGVRFEFVPMAWPEAVKALESGKVDLLNMIRTPERVGKYAFSDPHTVIAQALFRNVNHDAIDSLNTLSGSVIALQSYDIANEKLAGRRDFKRLFVNSKREGFVALNSGRVAGFFAAEQPGLYFLERHHLPHVEIAMLGLWPQPYCFAARLGSDALITMLNHGLRQLKRSGEYDAIIDRWRVQPDGWFERHEVELTIAAVLLLLLLLALWFWVFLLRRTVRRRAEALQQEQALLERSEATHRGLLEAMPVGVLIVQREVVVYANPAAEQMFGIDTSDEPLPLMQLATDSMKPLFARMLALDSEAEGAAGRLLRRDGSVFEAEVRSSRCDYHGEPALQLLIADMTGRRADEREIARLNDVVNQASDVIFCVDEAGRFTAMNEAGLRLAGVSRERMIGKPFADFVLPESLPRVQAMFAKKQRGEISQSRYEVQIKAAGGEVVTMEVDSRALMEDGRFAGIYGVGRDITARKQAEARLARQFERLQQLRRVLEQLNRAATLDAAFDAALAAAESLMGADRAAILLFDLDDQADGAMHFVAWRGLSERYRACVDGHTTWPRHEVDAEPIHLPHVQSADDMDEAIRHAIVEEGIRALAFYPLNDEQGVMGKFMLYYDRVHSFSGEDIDFAQILSANISATICRLRRGEEKLRLQRQVEHTQRLESLGVLAGGIAHDFNNILAAIMGNAAMADRHRVHDPGLVKSYLDKIVESSEAAALLCRQMLAYSGQGQFVVRPLNLSVKVESLSSLLAHSIGKSVSIRYQLEDALPLIEADEAQMQQVIMNLVINASEAMGEAGGEIRVTTGVQQLKRGYFAQEEVYAASDAKGGEHVFLQVSDSGSGMSKPVRQKLFDPFFTTKFAGRGLGMSAVLGIVRAHHGAIRVQSQLGKGSTFTLHFPVARGVAEGAAGEESPLEERAERATAAVGGTVLVVDDEEAIRETAAMMLEEAGFRAMTAVDGADAVAIYRHHCDEIDAVLLDMTMPRLDGRGALRELRRINARVKVILSSGYSEEEVTEQFAGEDIAGFVQKPYMPEALVDVVRRAL